MKALKVTLFSVYSLLVAYIVFFARRRHGIVWSEEYLNLLPVKRLVDNYHSSDVKRWDFYSNLIGNVFLFIPLPIFVQEIFLMRTKSLIVLGVFISILIESLQYAFHIGVADIDDVLLNTLGTIIGVFVWDIMRKILILF
ncbi:hypothetical protein GO988_13000 [Hymenobacter sp. HMF4947]|uniref:VanZ-like domain-containing protein n=1 Tax=Hymenobacter ginkgonis TaxID=2682976 RepID=A0A7K1TFR7_9BACT|nr:hypothetical protein [Hymenobacter ginkgonis]